MNHTANHDRTPFPWLQQNESLISEVRSAASCDSILVALCRIRTPCPDELLFSHGPKSENIHAAFASSLLKDELFAKAERNGVAMSSPDAPATKVSFLRTEHVLIQMVPESMAEGRWWVLLMTRASSAWSERDVQATGILLRRWQCSFLQPTESGMGCLLIGHDDRLIACDLSTRQRMLQQPDFARNLIQAMRPVVKQRYPRLGDDDMRDMALDIGDGPMWIRFRFGAASKSDDSRRWYIELRPLGPDELIPTGVVPDDRIAVSIVWLHEHFAESPSLAEVAKVVHMSPFHFHRLFSKQVTVSPKQYLQRKQLQVASWLLRATRMQISDVAERAGFSSHGHFTSTFHRLVGLSPSAYRDKH